ncbi:hypothetical protein M9H77_09938 [Catharanthus roseus]|uniref:Uncharacterized protein n=1 Tax=Catharanthus roseus TaxID=4058 RepID=A0ACC0C2K7_CATRO|nr:hypothetical protein M9H77_09938 [Catharanthus roseus]
MGRLPCCQKIGLKKGPWTPEEDKKLLSYIQRHGHGSWRALPEKAGLERCGKSCRLRWTNYLRPDIKRGKFNLQEEQTIIQLHAFLGNRWSAIASHLPKRTDNEIKNYWNTHLKKRLTKMGIDPMTHKPNNNALIIGCSSSSSSSSDQSNLNHMAQWESARVEAEARLVRTAATSINNPYHFRQSNLITTKSSPAVPVPAPAPAKVTALPCLDILKASERLLLLTNKPNNNNYYHPLIMMMNSNVGISTLESPTSVLQFSDNMNIITTHVPNLTKENDDHDHIVQNNYWPNKRTEKLPNDDHQMKVNVEEEIMMLHDHVEESLEGLINPSFMEGISEDLLLDNAADHQVNFNITAGGVYEDNNINLGEGNLEDNSKYWINSTL